MTISWIAERMPCGCGIRKFAPEETYDIEYCPKHKAAQDLYEAAKVALYWLDNTKKGDTVMADMLRQALAKADGGELLELRLG